MVDDLFQVLGVSRHADFEGIRKGYCRRIRYVKSYVKREDRCDEIRKAQEAWRILGPKGSRDGYLEQLQQDSMMSAARQEQDSQFQQEAARHLQGEVVHGQSNTLQQSNEFQAAHGWGQGKVPRPPAQWFKPVAKYALETISALKADLDFTYERTEQARRRLVVGLHAMPELVQGLDAYFSIIRRGFDLIAGAVVALEDDSRPAALASVRDEWVHRSSILVRLAESRDLAHRFRDKALALHHAADELLREDHTDTAREDELLDDLRVILERWLRLIDRFYTAPEPKLDVAMDIDSMN